MAFEFTAPDIQGSTGEFGYELSTPATFAEIFDSPSNYYSGSTILVQEVARIITLVTDPKLVDIDLRWFGGHKYLGTVRVGRDITYSSAQPKDNIFLNNSIQEIIRYSTYTIVGNLANNPEITGAITIEDCNFFTSTVPVTLTGASFTTNGQRLVAESPALLGITNTKIPELNLSASFFSRMPNLGFYLNPGVEMRDLRYKCQVINSIGTIQERAEPPVCELSPAASCEKQYLTFLATFSRHYATQSEAEAAQLNLELNEPDPNRQYALNLGTYTCPTDPTTQYPYFQVVSSGTT